MLMDKFNITINAQAETVWRFLLDRLANPQNYLRGVTQTRVLEKSDRELTREMMWEGKLIRERFSIDEAEFIVRSEILEHPIYTGNIDYQVLKTAVQNPMAPVRVNINVQLERKSLHLEDMVWTENETVKDIERELAIIKVKAEEKEREENSSRAGFGVNTGTPLKPRERPAQQRRPQQKI